MIQTAKGNATKEPLHNIFTDIPHHYDLVNRVFTWGMDNKWREKAARLCLSGKPQKILDLCCGTGDFTVTIARLADHSVEVKGLDYSQPMLDIARGKAALIKERNYAFIQSTAAKMPFPDAEFDCIGISFAFRNLTYQNPQAAENISEILRVLKPGGRCVIVESSQPRSKFMRASYHFYMRHYTYIVGALLSGNRVAYHYLAESSCQYYSPPEIKDLLIKSGFRDFSYKPLFGGVAAIYIATK